MVNRFTRIEELLEAWRSPSFKGWSRFQGWQLRCVIFRREER